MPKGSRRAPQEAGFSVHPSIFPRIRDQRPRRPSSANTPVRGSIASQSRGGSGSFVSYILLFTQRSARRVSQGGFRRLQSLFPETSVLDTGPHRGILCESKQCDRIGIYRKEF